MNKSKSQPMYWVVFAMDMDPVAMYDYDCNLVEELDHGDGDAWFMCFSEADALAKAEQLQKTIATDYIGNHMVVVLSFDEHGSPKKHRYCQTELAPKPVWS